MTSVKFLRSFQLKVTGRSGVELFINYPLTLTFDITNHIFSAANSAQFSLYNLSERNRSEILVDAQLKKIGGFPVTLNAGYQTQYPQAGAQLAAISKTSTPLPTIFNGFVNVAYTERNGPDLITRIDAMDLGDVATSDPSAVFPSAFRVARGTSFVDKVKSMMRLLKGVQVGAVIVTPVQPATTRDETYSGRVWDYLQSIAAHVGGNVFVENGVCNMLGQNDVVPGLNNLGELTSDTGLLNIPRYTGHTVTCSSVFEPALAIGKTIGLKSQYAGAPNGMYKIIQYSHRGTISGSVSGDAVSDITLVSLPSPVTPTL